METSTLKDALKTHFGYESFRPYQEEIIQALINQQDVFAVLPTGGGKSLCFQLPAMMQKGLVVVVSPLIALMKDQVDSLQANGLPATFLNSSLSSDEMRSRTQGLSKGAYRILYVAPERVMAGGFIELLKKWNINLIAIDEAHCISEWGHDFRIEYRQLSCLKEHFPNVPIIALTATATGRVGDDIVRQLHLKTPYRVVASFNRANLIYRVLPKHQGLSQLLAFLKNRTDESGIVYCLARKTCEDVAHRLNSAGISAQPYHAGLESDVRSHHQNLFLRDEIRVICATVAFGMGIHKSNVRFVVHYNLPRNIESYYQETGRAGRDGLPSECLLLFSAGDAANLSKFINEKSSEEERRIAQQQLAEMMAYAESSECRRKRLLNYFGESWPAEPCGTCDNCLEPRATFDATQPAQKILSCVYRIKEKSGFSVGLNHTVDVLIGRSTEKVKEWCHNEISTFGIGTEFKKSQWISLGQELIRNNYIELASAEFRTLSLTSKGWEALKSRQIITLTKPLSSLKPKHKRNDEPILDEDLFAQLRALRKSLADEQKVPAYIVFSDASLREMVRLHPVTLEEFGRINGVGQKKLSQFGSAFIEKIKTYQFKSIAMN